MMTTCILLAGCLEGWKEDVEDAIDAMAPGCNDPTALNYNESDTTNTTCITEEILFNSINEFVETMESENSTINYGQKGFVMTMSGVDEEMGVGAYTIVSTMAANSDFTYSSTEITVASLGMTITQSWLVTENGDGTLIQASYMDESFLLDSAMSLEDFEADLDDQTSDDEDDSDEEPGAAFYFTNIDTNSNNQVTWDEVDEFIIGADDGWESDEEREEAMEGFNLSDTDANAMLDFAEFEAWFNQMDDDDCHESCSECDGTEETDCTACPEGTTLVDHDGDGAGECMPNEDDSDDMDDGSDDMVLPDPMDILSMLDGIDEDCDEWPGEHACGFPESTGFNLGTDGITVSIPTEDGQSMEMTFECFTTTMRPGGVGCAMTGFGVDMEDGMQMEIELLTAVEMGPLLRFDMTLEYEALPFTIDAFDVFICDNGEQISAEWENDGMVDCTDGSDEDDWGDSDDDDDDPEFTSYWVGYETANWSCNWEDTADPGEDETAYFWSCDDIRDPPEDVGDNDWYYCEYYDDIATHYCTNGFGSQGTDENGEWGNSASFTHWRDGGDPRNVEDGGNDIYWMSYDDGYCEWEGDPDGDDTVWWCKESQDDVDWDTWWYYCENHGVDWHCTDDKGQSADYEHSANGTEWLDSGDDGDEMFTCDNGEEIPLDWVNDGMDDCGDGSDEFDDGSDEDGPPLMSIVSIGTDFAFEGALDDYSIVLASCTDETDSMGTTTVTCGEDLMSVGLVDAMTNAAEADSHSMLTNYSDIMFFDQDESGTLSEGDLIAVGGNMSVDWNHVRLHSTSADAYSDENPLHQMPGFTAILGVLSLMGAAMIGRRD